MPSYEVVNAIDSRIPSSAGNGTPFVILAQHDTEGGTGPAGAEGTIRFLIDRRDRNASYHEIISYEPLLRRFRIYQIVSMVRAAHSIAPQPISPTSGEPLYVPDAVVRGALGVNVWNPNQGVYAQAIAGKVADVAAYAADRYFLECMHRRALFLKAANPRMLVRAEHFRFNPRTRSDWGKVLTPKLGGVIIPKVLPEGENMPKIRRALHGISVPILEGASVRFDTTISDSSLDFRAKATTIRPFAIAEGDAWTANEGPMKGVRSDEWYAYVMGDSVRYIHIGNRADAERSDTAAMTARISAKDAAFARIAQEATKGKNA